MTATTGAGLHGWMDSVGKLPKGPLHGPSLGPSLGLLVPLRGDGKRSITVTKSVSHSVGQRACVGVGVAWQMTVLLDFILNPRRPRYLCSDPSTGVD